MATELGTELGTVLGTALGSMETDGTAKFDASKLYALSGFSAGNRFATQTDGGEAGTAAGFGTIEVVYLTSLGAARYLLNRANASVTAGHMYFLSSANLIRFAAGSGAGAATYSPGYTFTQSDLNKLFVLIGWHDSASLRLMTSRSQLGTGTAITGYTAQSAATTFSGAATDGATPAANSGALAGASFVGTPTEAQLRAVSDAIRTLGDIPAKAAIEALMPGTTVTHRWSLRDTLAAANVPVSDGAAAPATIPDSVTNASIDAMTKVGAPVVRVLDPATPKLWSYETTPILYGASGLDLSNYYDCPTALGEGSNSFWTAMMFTVTSQAVASKARVPFASASAAPSNISGFSMNTSGTNTLCSTTFYNGLGGGVSGPTGVIAPADVGKILLLVSVLDVPGGKARTYWKRVESGTGTNYTAYVASTAGMRIGRTYLATDYTPDGIQLWGVAAGIGLPSLAQVQAMFDQTQTNERIGSITGMTSLRIDLTQDALGNANALPASLTDRQSGTFNFTRTGAVSTAATYARAFGW